MHQGDFSWCAGLRVPPDNPFVKKNGHCPEIWALGLRNLSRFSFDAHRGALWLADVGQDRLEEIDIIRKGGNSAGMSWRATSVPRRLTRVAILIVPRRPPCRKNLEDHDKTMIPVAFSGMRESGVKSRLGNRAS